MKKQPVIETIPSSGLQGGLSQEGRLALKNLKKLKLTWKDLADGGATVGDARVYAEYHKWLGRYWLCARLVWGDEILVMKAIQHNCPELFKEGEVYYLTTSCIYKDKPCQCSLTEGAWPGFDARVVE